LILEYTRQRMHAWRNNSCLAASLKPQGLRRSVRDTNCLILLLKIFRSIFSFEDRLCGLEVRVLGYRSGSQGSIPGTTRKKKVVGLERGVHSAS
jgi:hypothetical protein